MVRLMAWSLLTWRGSSREDAARDDRKRDERLWQWAVMAGETVAAIVEAHRSGAASPEETIARAYARIRAHDDPAIFIALRAEADALAEAKALAAECTADRKLADSPLYGVPLARFTACPSRSSTISTPRDCPPPPPAPPSPIRRRKMRPASRASSAPAPSSSARPTSISSPPDWWACARPTASRATCSIRR